MGLVPALPTRSQVVQSGRRRGPWSDARIRAKAQLSAHPPLRPRVGDNPSVCANLDLVRSIYAAWERGDFSSAEWASAEIEFGFADGPEPGRWSGRGEMARRYGDWLRAWRDFRAEPEEYFVVDGQRVLVFVHNSGRGRTSGLEIEQRSVANFFEIRNGKVVRFVLYWDRDRALADLGLTEDAG
jgi:ketosteroid isomerase-like protein